MTGITRSTVAKVIAGYFHTTATHIGGSYDSYVVRDDENRQWKIMPDASVCCENRSGQNASSLYSVEFVTPICNRNNTLVSQKVLNEAVNDSTEKFYENLERNNLFDSPDEGFTNEIGGMSL